MLLLIRDRKPRHVVVPFHVDPVSLRVFTLYSWNQIGVENDFGTLQQCSVREMNGRRSCFGLIARGADEAQRTYHNRDAQTSPHSNLPFHSLGFVLILIVV